MNTSHLSLASITLVAALSACRASSSNPSRAPTQAPPAAPSTPSPTTRDDAPPTTPAPEPIMNDARAAAQGINRLGTDLYARLRATPGNLAIAPASIAVAFGMAAAGARGETLAQMRQTLHATLDPARQASTLGALSARWNSDLADGVVVRTANRLYGHTRYTFSDPYLTLTRSVFGAPLERVDFTQPEPARARINGWVATQTRDKIRDLLPPTAINAETRLVLVNAMYLHAAWQDEFRVAATRDEGFYVGGATATQVPTMHRLGRVGYAQRAGFRVVELPYRGDALAMDVLLPDARDGLGTLEASLDGDALDAALAALTPTQVDVALPRFRVETASLQLRASLEALGMRLPFQRLVADFTGIADPPRPDDQLYISEAFHKVFVDVNEAGTEAAAATAIVMARGGGMPTPAQASFVVDRPFLFVIRDRANGAVLFLGRVVDPRAPAR